MFPNESFRCYRFEPTNANIKFFCECHPNIFIGVLQGNDWYYINNPQNPVQKDGLSTLVLASLAQFYDCEGFYIADCGQGSLGEIYHCHTWDEVLSWNSERISRKVMVGSLEGTLENRDRQWLEKCLKAS